MFSQRSRAQAGLATDERDRVAVEQRNRRVVKVRGDAGALAVGAPPLIKLSFEIEKFG